MIPRGLIKGVLTDNRRKIMTEQKSNNPSEGQRQGGGDTPATQPSRGDKDSKPTEQGGDKGGNTPSQSNPSQGGSQGSQGGGRNS